MELNSIELRILGCLIEKESTTPDNYPLSTNALVNACNQASNRDPVVNYDERSVDAAMLELRPAGLARTVTGGRANKHRHIVDEAWGVSAGELAVLAVMFLRGPQTLGQLRGRTERMHRFDELEAVDRVLEALSTRHDPFVVQLSRQAGQKEARWAHLLGGSIPEPTSQGAAGPTGKAVSESRPPARHLVEELDRLRADVNRLYELLGEPRPGSS